MAELIRGGEPAGLPYGGIDWGLIPGQPFGAAVYFNGLILGDLTDLVDAEGPVAVAGDCASPRGMSVGYGRLGAMDLPLSPVDVRYLAGGDTRLDGVLAVAGHALTGGESFRVGQGSGYLIGKSGAAGQKQTLEALYAAEGGSPYWEPGDNGDSWTVSCYDAPRRIPAERVGADPGAFFDDASVWLERSAAALMALEPNGTAAQDGGDIMLSGSDPAQNVFRVDLRGAAEFSGSIGLSVPEGSLAIVQLLVPRSLTVKSPVWGAPGRERSTLFVLADTASLTAAFPTVFYGGFLAPRAAFSADTTGGSIDGTAVFAALEAAEGSGFELHWFPFAGGVSGVPVCPGDPGCPDCPDCPDCPQCPQCPECPQCPDCPECPECPDCPVVSGVLSGRVQADCWWTLCLLDRETGREIGRVRGRGPGLFRFETAADGDYLVRLRGGCSLTFYNVGVASVTVEC